MKYGIEAIHAVQNALGWAFAVAPAAVNNINNVNNATNATGAGEVVEGAGHAGKIIAAGTIAGLYVANRYLQAPAADAAVQNLKAELAKVKVAGKDGKKEDSIATKAFAQIEASKEMMAEFVKKFPSQKEVKAFFDNFKTPALQAEQLLKIKKELKKIVKEAANVALAKEAAAKIVAAHAAPVAPAQALAKAGVPAAAAAAAAAPAPVAAVVAAPVAAVVAKPDSKKAPAIK
jgi:hypothetical protein